MSAQYFWIPSSSNRKTGNIIQQFIGASRKESLETCKGCRLLDGTCYAQFGTPRMGHASILRAKDKEKKTLANALRQSDMDSRVARFGSIGCQCGIDREKVLEDVEAIRSAGLTPIMYEHHWRKGQKGEFLKGVALASCETVSQAILALRSGWKRVGLIVRGKKRPREIDGAPLVMCPADMKPGQVTCNSCGGKDGPLCDGSKSPMVIGFKLKKRGRSNGF